MKLDEEINKYNLAGVMKLMALTDEIIFFDYIYGKLQLLEEIGDEFLARFIFIVIIKSIQKKILTDYEKIIILGYRFTPYRRRDKRTFFDVIWKTAPKLDINRMIEYDRIITTKHFFRVMETKINIDYSGILLERFFLLGKLTSDAFMYIYKKLNLDDKAVMGIYTLTFIYHYIALDCVDDVISLADFEALLIDAKQLGHKICCVLDRKGIRSIFKKKQLWHLWYKYMEQDEIAKLNPYIMECIRRQSI